MKHEPEALVDGEDTPSVGPRLKLLRRSRRLTLKALAEAAGCSESLLSRVENGRVVPSLSTLHRLCRALGVSVAALIETPADDICVVYGPSDRPRSPRSEAEEGDGSLAESLIPYAEARLLEGLIVHLPADGRWCGPFQHEGEEVGLVLDGELELVVSGRDYRVASGASFFFNSARPHSYRAAGAKRCRVVWINTPPSF